MARRGNGRRGILQPGHGSSGPRRIKGNFMEIGFIHNYIHLCVFHAEQSKQRAEVIAQKELLLLPVRRRCRRAILHLG